IPLAPGRFSTITCCPRRSAIFGAMSRDMMSVVLPGGNGMMMRIGLDGYEEDEGWACASAPTDNPKMVTVTILAKSRRGFIVLLGKTWSVPVFGSFSVLRERGVQPSQNGRGHLGSQHGFPPLGND